jgi:hypothetical protein
VSKETVMTPITLFASLTTAAAVGAAGYAAFTGAGVGTRAQVSPAVAIPAAQAQVAPPAELPAAAQAVPATSVEEDGSITRTPRQCRPDQGIDRDCEFL